MIDKDRIQKAIESMPEIKYVMGVDCHDDIGAYCLMRFIDGKEPEMILSKKKINDVQFEEEVENLSKYFNATILKDG